MTSPASRYSIPASFASLSLAMLLLNAGCASPGTPRPPSLQLPAVVTNLAAERVGDQVRLRWTTPAKTTDNLNLLGPTTAEFCRAILAPGHTLAQSPAPACAPIRRLAVQPGFCGTTDSLPPALITDPQQLLLYRVTLLNNHGRSAGSSAPAFAVAGAAPPAITDLRGQATNKGALLQWWPADDADAIEVIRLHRVTSSPRPDGGQPLLSAPKEPVELHLRAGGPTSEATPFRPDASGTLDPTAHRGETYTYTAQRVRKVLLQGQAFELRSATSAAVTIVMRDTFPPATPTDLEAVATGQPPSIDLSWKPNIESDLRGYLVYRQELTQNGAAVGSLTRVTPDPIAAPGFHDASVLPGHIYAYTVTAIDAKGNESPPSAAAREDVRLP